MIDYQGIIEQLDTEKVKLLLERMDIPFQETESYLLMPTACHNEDLDTASWKLYYYKNNHIFYCYTECSAMSIFKFLKNYYKVRQIEFDWYQDIYKIVLDCSNFSENFTEPRTYKKVRDRYQRQEVAELPIYSDKVLDCFTKFYAPEWLNDGITRAAMDKFNILYSIPQNKIIIPHYNLKNELVGIRGRALNEWEIENIGKYMPIQVENIWYSHPLSLNLYGLNLTKDNIKKEGICFLGEGEKFVLQMENFNRLNCAAAVCGSQFNKFALKLLVQSCHPKEIIICFDKEELPGESTYFDKLYSIGKKYSNYANFSFIYDMENLLKLKESPTDRGEEVFERLLGRRVKIK